MNSFLLVSKNIAAQQAYLDSFIKEHAISPFDQILISEEGSTGIEIIRKFQEKIFLKPYKSKEKIIIIEHAEDITIEGQNALLKILEEPPSNTFIFLLVTNEDILLPTILSRCQIVILHKNETLLSQETKEKLEEDIQILLTGSINDKLALAEKIYSDKTAAKEWFTQIINVEYEIFHIKHASIHIQLLQILHKAYKEFQTTNVNLRIILEHYFLQL